MMITVPVNHLRRAPGHAVSWSAHPHGDAATGPADLVLPLALAATLPAPAARAPETPAASGRRRRAVRRRATAAAVRR